MRFLNLLPHTKAAKTMEKEDDIKVASANLKDPLSSSQIDQRLHQSFQLALRSPSHPACASMVFKAITELREENGSSEDSISEYIKANYDDLPWAHKSIQTHHLKWLCDEGLIVLLTSNRYSIPGFTSKPVLENSEPKLITYEKLAHGRKRSFLFQESENRLVTDLSIPEIIKARPRKIIRRYDQLLTGGSEEESLKDDSSDDDDDYCYHPFETRTLVKKMKKDGAYKLTDRLIVCALAAIKLPKPTEPKRHVTSQLFLALEDDSSDDDSLKNRVSFEKLIEEKKEVIADKQTDCFVVYALAANQTEPKRRLTRPRQFESKVQPKMKLQETESNWPSWIQSLLQTDFYGQCKAHGDVAKSVCNLYCIDCKNGALCNSCVTSHEDEGHHMNQTDCEVAVEVSVIGKHIDISEIQTLKTSATSTTIVLKRTIPSWFSKPAIAYNVCQFCKRRAPFPFKFCALSCKFQHEHKVR